MNHLFAMSMHLADPAWLDQQYNPLASMPDSPALFARWAQASAQARAQTQNRIDIRYGDGPKQTLDWFSAQRENAPVLVFIHGGYWRGSDKSVNSFIAPAFLDKGCDVVLLNYDLCPTVSMEELVLQVADGMAYVHRHSAAHGCDPKRLVVSGHSAGGHLTAMMLAYDWKKVGRDLPDDLTTRGLAISGLFDLEPFRYAPFLKDLVRLDARSSQRLSPVLFAPPTGRVLNAVVGGLESGEFHRQTQGLADAWGSDVVPVHASIAGKDHFTIVEDLALTGTPLHEMACRLLGIQGAAQAA